MKIKRHSILAWALISSLGMYGLVLLLLSTPNCAPRDESHQAQAPIPTPRIEDKNREQLAGFAMSIHNTHDVETLFPTIDDIRNMGGNSVKIVTPGYQRHGASMSISRPDPLTPSYDELSRIIAYAKAKGLRVTLMPIVLFSHPRGNEWRGKINPPDWDQWWKSYNQFILEFAVFAEQNGVDTFSVGSELLSTEKQTARWDSLIAQVRKQYSGRLTYSTNWDHYHVPEFWPKLDMIGLNAYWKLTSDVDVPDTQLIRSWQQIRRKVVAFSKKQDRPVVFTEIGYPSLPWALRDPWNYIARGESSDEETQLRGHRAFWTAWWDLLGPDRPEYTQNPLAGVFVYEMTPFHYGGPKDTGYSVRNKKAGVYLKERFEARQKK